MDQGKKIRQLSCLKSFQCHYSTLHTEYEQSKMFTQSLRQLLIKFVCNVFKLLLFVCLFAFVDAYIKDWQMSNHVGIHPHILEVENMTSFIQSCVKLSTKGKLRIETTTTFQTSLKLQLPLRNCKEPKQTSITKLLATVSLVTS